MKDINLEIREIMTDIRANTRCHNTKHSSFNVYSYVIDNVLRQGLSNKRIKDIVINSIGGLV